MLQAVIVRAISFAALLLIGQEGDLEQDYQRAHRGSRLAMLTIIATYADGSPMRGTIACGGWWFKHQDGADHITVEALPFATDARGAVILNPHLDDAWLVCEATDGVRSGSVTVSFSDDHPTGVYRVEVS